MKSNIDLLKLMSMKPQLEITQQLSLVGNWFLKTQAR